MIYIPIAIYMLLCLLVAYRGRGTEVGYLGTFLLSVFLTPIIIYLGLLLLTAPPERKA